MLINFKINRKLFLLDMNPILNRAQIFK